MQTTFTSAMKLQACSAALLATLNLPIEAANWAQWRGPSFNGSTTETGLPATFSKTENVAWSTPMPGPSASTPIIWGDSVFASSGDRETKCMMAMALDRKTGKVLWQQKVADGYNRDDKSNYSSPSPVTDGKLVVFFYGNGEMVAYDIKGKKLWSRNIQTDYGDFAFQWTFSAGPLLHGGRLYQQVLQRDTPVRGRGKENGESFVLAMDPANGKTLWRQVRPCEAVQESREAYSTPLPCEFNGRKELVIVGGDCITGHNPETGAELWRWGTWNPTKIGHWRHVPSAVLGDGIFLACAPKRDPVYAIRAGGNGKLDDSAIAWVSDARQTGMSSDVPTPLFYQGDFFVLSDVYKKLVRVEPKTGKVKWSLDTPGNAKYEASPTGADGKIYLQNFAGDVVVVDAAKGQVIHKTAMGEPGDNETRSTVAVSQGQIFIRTNGKLFCVGKS
jgi:outer membrane protein assembly factor BamB